MPARTSATWGPLCCHQNLHEEPCRDFRGSLLLIFSTCSWLGGGRTFLSKFRSLLPHFVAWFLLFFPFICFFLFSLFFPFLSPFFSRFPHIPVCVFFRRFCSAATPLHWSSPGLPTLLHSSAAAAQVGSWSGTPAALALFRKLILNLWGLGVAPKAQIGPGGPLWAFACMRSLLGHMYAQRYYHACNELVTNGAPWDPMGAPGALGGFLRL